MRKAIEFDSLIFILALGREGREGARARGGRRNISHVINYIEQIQIHDIFVSSLDVIENI